MVRRQSSLVNLLGLAASAVLAAGCAGSIRGELDGKSVSSFSEAVFGGAEDLGPAEVFAVFGAAMPGDSCADYVDVIDLYGKVTKADDNDELDNVLNDTADLYNERVPVGSWFVTMSFVGPDIDDVKEETYDLEDLDEGTSITFSVCLREDEAEVETRDNQPTLDAGNECFKAAEGELTFILNDDDSQLRITGQDIEMEFDDGDNAGDVDIDFTFSACPEMGEAVEDLFD